MSLAPDSLGPTNCVGEILAEIVATTVGDGFLEPISLIGPCPSGAPAIFIVPCGRIGGAYVDRRLAVLRGQIGPMPRHRQHMSQAAGAANKALCPRTFLSSMSKAA